MASRYAPSVVSYTSSNVTFVVLKNQYYDLANHTTLSNYHTLNFRLSFASSLTIKTPSPFGKVSYIAI